MRERLGPSDRRFLAVCLLILVGTVWFSARFFYRAFPEASIDFRVSRAEARNLAADFLQLQGLDRTGYREAARFRYDDNAKTFLERSLGLERANQLMGSRVRLWQWSHRWFRPQQKEEFQVDVTPRGEIVSFAHLLPEAAALPSLPPDQARAAAESFLRQRMHRDPAGLDFVEASSLARPARTDHSFTWKERDFNIQDATYRLEVTVLGNQVGGYHEYLKVPEAWIRDYERLRSRNLTAQTVDTAVMLLVVVGLLVMLLGFVRTHEVRWRVAAAVGGIGAALMFLSGWNSQPLAEFGYPTTDSYASFLTRQFFQNLLSALAGGGALFLLTAGAEPLYRRAYGSRLALGNLFSPSGLRTKSFLRGTVLGLTLTGIFVAYQTAFYLTAARFGAWSPADVPYDDLLNTRLPWLFVLLGGFLPAVSEEFLFRMFSIPFLQKLFRSTAAAVVLAGFIWGFGHAGYPQQPFYIRGVEVGIGGVVLGCVMLRWGILPTLVWHYSVDAMYSALLLTRSHNLYFVLSGAASAGIMVLPALIAWIAYLRRGGFESEQGLTNQDEAAVLSESPPHEAPAPAAPVAYQSWSARHRMVGLALAAACVVFLAVPVERFGDRPRFEQSREQARAAGDRFLAAQGLANRGFQAIVYDIDSYDSEAGKYFLSRRPVSWLAEAYSRDIPLYGWVVRYFKPLDREELRVAIRPDTGKVFGFDHTLPEDRPGADLTPDEAQRLASAHLAASGFDLARLELKETSSEKKKARRDHSLVWEARPGDPRNVDEARYRVSVTVGGDRVISLRTSWKLPEAFVRERSSRNALSIALSLLRLAFLVGGAVAALWLLVDRTRAHQLRWRPPMAVAAPLAVLGLLEALTQFPLVYRGYSTAVPESTFLAIVGTGLLISVVGSFVGLAGASGLILALHPESLAVFRRDYRRRAGIDALVAVALALAIVAALNHLEWILAGRFHAQALFSVDAPALFAGALPPLSAVAGALRQTLFALAGLALVVYVAGLRPRLLLPLILVGAAAFVSRDVHTPAELALEYVNMLAGLAVGVAFCRWFAAHNWLAYALAAVSLALGSAAVDLLSQPVFRVQGWITIALLALGLLAAVRPALTRSASTS